MIFSKHILYCHHSFAQKSLVAFHLRLKSQCLITAWSGYAFRVHLLYFPILPVPVITSPFILAVVPWTCPVWQSYFLFGIFTLVINSIQTIPLCTDYHIHGFFLTFWSQIRSELPRGDPPNHPIINSLNYSN